MADKEEGSFSDLTEDELKILKGALTRVEGKLFRDTLTKLWKFLFAWFGILTVGGLITFTGIKQIVISTASRQIGNSPSVRSEVVEEAASELRELVEMKEEISELKKELQTEREQAHMILQNNLNDILQMMEQLVEDMGNTVPQNDSLEGGGVRK